MAQETYDRAADPGGSGAGKAAVHLTDEHEDEMAGGPQG
jgi:hypothetical protein